jgi:F-type H+-transporting ATPase subunit alpha
MEAHYSDVLADFKAGKLPEEGINRMVEMAKGLIPQFKD